MLFFPVKVDKIPAYYAAEAGFIDILQVFIDNKFDIHSIIKVLFSSITIIKYIPAEKAKNTN